MEGAFGDVYERALADELRRGASPRIAHARARAAELRAVYQQNHQGPRGSVEAIVDEAAEDPSLKAAWARAKRAFSLGLGRRRSLPDEIYDHTLAAELANGLSPRVALARARAAGIRARRRKAGSAVEDEIYGRTGQRQQSGGAPIRLARARAEAARLRARYGGSGNRPQD